MNNKNRNTLKAIFQEPTLSNINFVDIETLIIALGGTVSERAGSRIIITLNGERWHCHRPHPGREAYRYQVEQAREFLEQVGITP